MIKTSPVNANDEASLIDSLDRKEILGTIAGDDTILVVVEGKDHRLALEKEFRGLPGRQELSRLTSQLHFIIPNLESKGEIQR